MTICNLKGVTCHECWCFKDLKRLEDRFKGSRVRSMVWFLKSTVAVLAQCSHEPHFQQQAVVCLKKLIKPQFTFHTKPKHSQTDHILVKICESFPKWPKK